VRGTASGRSTARSVAFGSRSERTRAGVGKRNEPCPDRAATLPEPPSGESRRGGGNPRGRNAMCSGWSRHTEGRRQRRPGVDAREGTGGREQRGRSPGEADQETGPGEELARRRRCRSSCRARLVFHHASTPDGSGAGTPRGPARQRARSWGEQRRSSELLLRLTGCGSIVRESDVSVPTLEGQANTTGAAVAAPATTNGSHASNL
jgi:hypothetical protein